MTWTESTLDETTTEWERSDGNATIRMRRRTDGGFTVRLDRLFQAPDGQLYRSERADDEAHARELVETWQTEFDVDG